MIPARIAYLALNGLKFGGLAFLDRAPEGFDPVALLTAPRAVLALEPWIGPRNATRLAAARVDVDLDRIETDLQRESIDAVTLADPDYPALLTRIASPPLVLYARGTPPKGTPWVAVVGTRRATPYGLQMAATLARDMASAGAVIISGLAAGIDAAAHSGALAAAAPNGGPGATVAVLGCGVDQTYPPQNVVLQRRIESEGWVVSEMPPGTAPHAHHFPRRNRIIAGMSVATVVVEAPERSGARITARLAIEEGREVFAVPGPATSQTCAGSNALLKEGAGVTTEARDILEHYGARMPGEPMAAGIRETVSHAAMEVLHALSIEGTSVDELATTTGLELPALYEVLIELVSQRAAVRQPGGRYAPTEQGLANFESRS